MINTSKFTSMAREIILKNTSIKSNNKQKLESGDVCNSLGLCLFVSMNNICFMSFWVSLLVSSYLNSFICDFMGQIWF